MSSEAYGDFLSGGELGALLRKMEWTETPLGPIATWPQSLRSVVSICLNSPLPMALFWGPQFVIFYNDPWQALLGYRYPQALGSPAAAVVDEIWRIIKPGVAQVMTAGQGILRENQLLTAHWNSPGEAHYVDVALNPVYGEGGGVVGVCAIAVACNGWVSGPQPPTSQDPGEDTETAPAVVDSELPISDTREQSAAGLAAPNWEQDLQAELVTILDSMSEGFLICDRAWQITYMNAAAERHAGQPRGRLLGQVCWDVLPFMRRTYVERELRRAMRNQVAVRFEFYAESDGKWYEVEAFPIQGGKLGIYNRDITSYKRTESELRQSEERYHDLAEAIDEGFCIVEMLFDSANTPVDYRFLEINATFEEQTGLEQPVGKTARELVPQLDASWFKIYGDVAQTGESTRFENHAPAMDRWFDVYAFRVGLPEARKVAILFNNITTRKQAEASLRKSEQELRELSLSLEERVREQTKQVRNLVVQLTMSEQEERRRISGILHDDLQQRLYGIQFQVNTLHTLVGKEYRQPVLDAIREVEKALSHTIEITRNLSVDLSPPILHNEGLAEALGWLAPHMERQYGLSVKVMAEDDLPAPDNDLRVLLFQCVRELLFNVVKHGGVSDAVVSLRRSDNHLHIEVSDQGKGFQVEQIMGATIYSHGLLQIRRRLELVNGHMRIESGPGEGTQIILSCPVHDGTT